MRKKIEVNYNQIVGECFGNWKVLEYLGKNVSGKHSYKCLCNCGNERTVEYRPLVMGNSKSWGCLKKVSKETKDKNRKKYKADYFKKNKKELVRKTTERQSKLPKIVRKRKMFDLWNYIWRKWVGFKDGYRPQSWDKYCKRPLVP